MYSESSLVPVVPPTDETTDTDCCWSVEKYSEDLIIGGVGGVGNRDDVSLKALSNDGIDGDSYLGGGLGKEYVDGVSWLVDSSCLFGSPDDNLLTEAGLLVLSFLEEINSLLD